MNELTEARERIKERIARGTASGDILEQKLAYELQDILTLIDGKADQPEASPELPLSEPKQQ